MIAASRADWFTAIGTVGTLTVLVIINLIQAVHSWRRWRRGQAEQLALWLSDPMAPNGVATVTAKNGSRDPLYGVKVWVTAEGEKKEADTGRFHQWTVLPPECTLQQDLPAGISASVSTPPDGFRAAATFTDARGHKWKRLPGKKLRTYRPPAPKQARQRATPFTVDPPRRKPKAKPE